MIGFELEDKKEKFFLGVEKGVTSIIFTRVFNKEKNEIHLVVGGMDNAESKSLTWISRDVLPGEKFEIKISEIKNVSKPQKSIELNSNNLIWEGKLRAYHGLKKELDEAGLI